MPVKSIPGALLASLLFFTACNKEIKQPNFLICMADDWGWPHAGALGDPVVKTPTFDLLASEGILLEHTYVSSPSCTPSRNAVLTGQYHWRLEEGANLWSTLDIKHPVYPLLLQEAGYFIGHWRKCWGPGDLKAGGYEDSYPGGARFEGIEDFLAQKPEGQPFCFWLGASDPHRGYKPGSGAEAGIPVDSVRVPDFYPDIDVIRSDIADYYFEVQRFDRDVGMAIELLRKRGELDHTFVLMTGDNGIPFPRCKSNLYDMGVRVPMAIRYGTVRKPGRKIQDFVSFTDIAPTILDLAGVEIPEVMSGNSLLNLMKSKKESNIDAQRDLVIFGKERHVPAQLAPSKNGYPSRGIRTRKWAYLYNFNPERWPVGVPDGGSHPMGSFADCDNGPTKQAIMALKDDPDGDQFYQWSFGKRPQEELYDMEKDPYQLNNLAYDPAFANVVADMQERLFNALTISQDPRLIGDGEAFDNYPYRAGYKLREAPE